MGANQTVIERSESQTYVACFAVLHGLLSTTAQYLEVLRVTLHVTGFPGKGHVASVENNVSMKS